MGVGLQGRGSDHPETQDKLWALVGHTEGAVLQSCPPAQRVLCPAKASGSEGKQAGVLNRLSQGEQQRTTPLPSPRGAVSARPGGPFLGI